VSSGEFSHAAGGEAARELSKEVTAFLSHLAAPLAGRVRRARENARMTLAYHIILSAYGFWLPNDPRGSWSDFVGAWELFRYGKATTTSTRVSVAGAAHDRHERLATKESLKYPAVKFTAEQMDAVARGFGESLRKGGVTCWACSI